MNDGELHFFAGFVAFVTVITAVLAQTSDRKAFLGSCLLARTIGLVGLVTRRHEMIRCSHCAFTLALWVGAVTCGGAELRLIAALAVFTLMSRWALGHYMFAAARGASDTNDPRYDLLYVAPLLVSVARF